MNIVSSIRLKKMKFSLFPACITINNFFYSPHHSLRQLVGTGSFFVSAQVSEKFCRNFFGLHTLAEFRDCLEVAVAASFKRNIVDSVFIIPLKVNDSGASAGCLVCDLFHTPILLQRLNRVKFAGLNRGAETKENAYEHAEYECRHA